jgi:membrane-associated HD superfamily phosphohydrolase
MIADQLEATARSAPPADDAAARAVVQQTIARIREEGELEESGLTSGHFARLEMALARTLQAMYHGRLKYPPRGPESRVTTRLAAAARGLLRG